MERAFLHFLFQLAHLAGELVERQDFLRALLRLHDGVEQDDRAEAATDAVEERQREDFECAAFLHGSRRLVDAEMSVNSTPGVPTRTRSPGRTEARSRTRAPFTHVP